MKKKIIAIVCVLALLINGSLLQAFAGTGEESYTKLSFQDFGFGEVTTVSNVEEQCKSAGEGTLNQVTIEGVYHFSQGGNQLIFGGSWKGFRIMPNTDGNLEVDYIDNNGSSNPLESILSGDAGALTGTDIKMEVAFAFANENEGTADVTVTVTINETYTKSYELQGVATSTFARTMLLYAAAGSSMTIKEEYTTFTFEDFGIEETAKVSGADATTAGELTLSAGEETLNKVEVSGIYNFSQGGNYLYFGGSWMGVRIASNTDGNLEVIYVDASGNVTDLGTITTTEADTKLTDKDVKIEVSFAFSNENGDTADVKVRVTIEDKYRETYPISGAATNTLKRTMYMWSQNSECPLILRVLRPSSNLKDITPADFNITETSITGEKLGTYTGENLANTRFSTYITMEDGSGYHNIYYGGIAGGSYNGWDGIHIKAYAGTIQISDDIRGAIGTLNLTTDVAKTNFLGQQVKLSITTEYVDYDRDGEENDVMLGIYFNDRLYNNEPIILPNRVGTMGNCLFFYATANATTPIMLATPAQLTLDDVGIVSGRYDNSYYVEEQYADSLMNTVLTQNITFSKHANNWINYAGAISWGGIRFVTQADGTIVIRQGNGEFTTEYLLDPEIAKTELLGKELELKLELYQSGADAKLGVYIDGKLYNNQPFDLIGAADKFGGYVGYYVGDANGYVELRTGVSCELYNLAYGSYILSSKSLVGATDGTFTVDGVVPSSWTITTPGDYTITSTGDGAYTKRVVLYYYGDAHPDGEIDVRDLVAVKKVSKNEELPSKSAQKGADVDGNGTVNAEDLNSIRDNILGPQAIQNVKDNAVYYTENVMPIAGYSGPRRTTDKNGKSYDYLTDEIYQMIKDLGINLISYTTSLYHTDEDEKAEILEGLALAEKYGLGVYVRDGRLGSKDDYTLAKFVSDFAEYTSFKGFAVIDEPFTSYYGYKYWAQEKAQLEDYDEIASNVNSYTNTIGYVNLNPMVASLGTTTTSYKDDYEKYVEEYIDFYDARLLSFDYYPFDANRTNAGYFDNLSVIRANALEHNIPFWAFIQAGTNWNNNVNTELSVTVNDTPTKGEMLWNVNTSLAYGAKGISYFPLIQPPYFSYTTGGTYDYTRNGLIGANGVANGVTDGWYYYAQVANKQIAAVDEVLMNAKSLEILAIGETAQTETGSTVVSYKPLKSENGIEASNGAIVGVFDYQGKTAFYVVNYDTVNTQTVTLNFDGTKQYSIISATQNTVTSGERCALSLEAGGAALVVVE